MSPHLVTNENKSEKIGRKILKTDKIEGKTCIYYKVVIHGGQKILNFTKNYFYKDAHYYLNRKYNQFNAEVKSEIAQGSEPP